MASVTCPACGTGSAPGFSAKDRNRRTTSESFTYFRCPSCLLFFLHPVPGNLSPYYPAEYYIVPTGLEQLAGSARRERYKIDLVRRFASSGRLLEIGPAWGTFAHLAKEAGFEVTTVERDPRCCRFLEEVVGVRAIQGDDVAKALEEHPPYHAIAMWHVLEHLPDPWGTLDLLAGKLAPGGILVIATPNPESWQFRVMGTLWPHIDAPRHLCLIPPTLLSRKGREAGMETVFLTTRDAGSIGWNTFGWQYFLSNFFRNRFLRMGSYLAGYPFGLALRPLESGEGRGSAYTMVLRRSPS